MDSTCSPTGGMNSELCRRDGGLSGVCTSEVSWWGLLNEIAIWEVDSIVKLEEMWDKKIQGRNASNVLCYFIKKAMKITVSPFNGRMDGRTNRKMDGWLLMWMDNWTNSFDLDGRMVGLVSVLCSVVSHLSLEHWIRMGATNLFSYVQCLFPAGCHGPPIFHPPAGSLFAILPCLGLASWIILLRGGLQLLTSHRQGHGQLLHHKCHPYRGSLLPMPNLDDPMARTGILRLQALQGPYIHRSNTLGTATTQQASQNWWAKQVYAV